MNRENIWMHIDAAYAGSAFICPEYRWDVNQLATATTINNNSYQQQQC